MAHIEVNHVGVEYLMRRTGEKIQALEDLHFSVEAGKFICIVGTSGCGKTTLLKLCAGLLAPSSGSINIGGNLVKGPGKDRAMVFQTSALLPWRSVLRNVTYGLELQGWRKKEACDEARKLIDLVGLTNFEESFPRELSGGMQQRVNLARALVTKPELLLMDEPFASLDGQMREFMQVEIERIWLRTGQTTLFVTHLIDEAIFLADEIIIMTNRPGKVKKIIPVNLPRNRSISIKKSVEFHSIEDELRDLIQEEFDEMILQTNRIPA